MKVAAPIMGALALQLTFGQGLALADNPPGNPASVKQDETTGEWKDKNGDPDL